MREPAFCICENNHADQLRGNREADQRFCFRYTDSTIPLPPKYEISSLSPSSVTVQPGLCRTCRSETPKTGFSQNEAHMINEYRNDPMVAMYTRIRGFHKEQYGLELLKAVFYLYA